MQAKKTIFHYVTTAMLGVFSATAAASGFALIEQSGSGLGNAYAGGAAVAEDASTVFFNPAGMSRIPGKQVAVALHVIDPSMKFTNTGSTAATGVPLGSAPGSAGSLAFIPNAYFTMEINPQTRFGIGVNAPFGLKTEYPAGWMGRFQALKSSIATINVNPSVSYQVSDTVSIGAGLNYQKINAELTSARSLGGGAEGLTTMKGSDDSWGYNLGLLMNLSSGGRLGLAYRSSINYKLEGFALVTTAAGATVANNAITAALKTPDTLSLSYFQPLDEKWDVMADISRTGWGNFKELRVIKASDGTTSQLTPENFHNTWRYSVGANHHYNEKWMARVGVAYDQSGVSDADRNARIPDNNRTWLAFGGQYKPDPKSAIDFGYAHLFVKDSTINNNTGAAGTPSPTTVGNLVGTYKNSVDILSMQYTHSF